jgi:hypothetical protein
MQVEINAGMTATTQEDRMRCEAEVGAWWWWWLE